jgi:hypothetical protein
MAADIHPNGAPVSLAIDAAALRPLIEQVVTETLRQLQEINATLPDCLAFSEQEAARLIGLSTWQLRDERLRGRISASQVTGRRIRYQRSDLLQYLESRRWAGGGTP